MYCNSKIICYFSLYNRISNTSSRSARDDEESTLIGLTNWGWGGTSRKDYTESGGGGRRDDSSDSSDDEDNTAEGGHSQHCKCKECWESRYGPHRYDGR